MHVMGDVAVNHFINLADYTDPADVEYSFVSFKAREPWLDALAARGLHTYALRLSGRRQLLRAFRATSRIMRDEDPDIVHAHLFEPTLASVFAARAQKRHLVMTRHHSDAHHVLESRLKRAVYLRLERFINARAEHIIAPAKTVRDILVDWEGVPAEKVSLIHYAQTSDRYDAVLPENVRRVENELGSRHNLALLCVSRLFHRKGHSYLFNAFAQLVRDGLDATLYLLGGGDYRAELEALASRLGISDRVRFLGWRADVFEIMRASDVLVHPSLEDALSQALIEALMLGLPIVATDISGADEILGGGQFGTLVPAGDARALREALRNVIADLPAARAKAAGGCAYLLELMDARRVAAAHVEIYRRVMRIGRR